MATLTGLNAFGLRDPSPEGMAVCAKALANPGVDPWDVAEVFDQFRGWLRRDAHLASRLIGGAGLQSVIVMALKLHGQNLEVARLGAGVVAGCCKRNSYNTAKMLKAGVVQVIHGLMDMHIKDTAVQDDSCVALWRLASDHGSGAEDIVCAGGMERILRALQEHPRSPFVHVNGCLAFEQLYLKGGAAAEGMKKAAQMAMALHPANAQIGRTAQRLLRTLEHPPARLPGQTGAAPILQRRSSLQAGKLEDCRQTMASLPFREWLLELDSSGFLMEYHRHLSQNFESVAQVVAVYAKSGEIDPQFFDDVGVSKLGHRRLFQKWCHEVLQDGERRGQWWLHWPSQGGGRTPRPRSVLTPKG